MDINVILSILSFLVGAIIGVAWMRSHIVLSVLNKGQYFLQTKDSCYIVLEAHPDGEIIEIKGEENAAQ